MDGGCVLLHSFMKKTQKRPHEKLKKQNANMQTC